MVYGKVSKTWHFSKPPLTPNTEHPTMSGVNVSMSTTNWTGFTGQRAEFKVNAAVKSNELGEDWHGKIKIYAAGVYDDGSETLPHHAFNSDSMDFGDIEDKNILILKLQYAQMESFHILIVCLMTQGW